MSQRDPLLREIEAICDAKPLAAADDWLARIEPSRLTQLEYLELLGAAADRIADCERFDAAEAAAAAARIAIRAGSLYDRRSGEQTAVLFGLVTRHLRYRSSDFRRGAEVEGLTQIVNLWIEIWARAEAALEPPAAPGAAAATPVDDDRTMLVGAAAATARGQPRLRNQALLRAALDAARDHYIAYLTELAEIAALRPRLNALAASIADLQLQARLAA